MHVLLAKITGTSAITNLKSFLVSIDTEMEKFQGFLNRLYDYEKKVIEFRQAFVKAPNEARLQRWIDAEGDRAAVATIVQQLSTEMGGRRSQLLAEGGPSKITAAANEAAAALDARETELIEADRKKAEELGVPVRTQAAFDEIERLRHNLDQAISWSLLQPQSAVGLLQSVIGGHR